MKSKISFISTGILKNDLKRFSWLGIAYLLTLLFAVPLQLVLLFSRPETIKVNYSAYTYLNVFSINYSSVLMLLMLLVPVLAGLLLFRYLQCREAADAEHALPIKRQTLYNTHTLAGFILLSLPLIITALVSWAVVVGLDINLVKGSDIANWLKYSLLLTLLLFLATVITGMFTGLSSVQGALTYILLLVPSGLSALVLHNLNMYIYGFPYVYFTYNLNNLSPLLRLLEYTRTPLQMGEIILYLVICVLLYFIGGYLYRYRKVEAAGNAITFEALRPVFKYAVTFCTMLLVGSYFYSSTQQSIPWTCFGYFLGAPLGYFLTEILMTKSLRVFQAWHFKGLGLYSLAVILLITLINTDVIGYEAKLPDPQQVKSVYMDSSYYPLIHKYSDSLATNQPHQAIYTERENIENILELQREIVFNRTKEKRPSLSGYNMGSRGIYLAYELENGQKLYRQYSILHADYESQLKAIYESREYKYHNYEVLRMDPAAIKLMDINCHGKNLNISDPVQLQQALKALQSDIYAQTYEQMYDGKPSRGYISITMETENDRETSEFEVITRQGVLVESQKYYDYGVTWERSYTNFEAWLESNGLLDKVRLIPGIDISHAVFNYVPNGMDENAFRRFMERKTVYAHDDFLKDEGTKEVKVSDPETLDLCLQKYQDKYRPGPIYTIVFSLNNGSTISGFLTPSVTPDSVKQLFRS